MNIGDRFFPYVNKNVDLLSCYGGGVDESHSEKKAYSGPDEVVKAWESELRKVLEIPPTVFSYKRKSNELTVFDSKSIFNSLLPSCRLPKRPALSMCEIKRFDLPDPSQDAYNTCLSLDHCVDGPVLAVANKTQIYLAKLMRDGSLGAIHGLFPESDKAIWAIDLSSSRCAFTREGDGGAHIFVGQADSEALECVYESSSQTPIRPVRWENHNRGLIWAQGTSFSYQDLRAPFSERIAHEVPGQAITSFDLSPDENTLVLGTNGGELFLYDVRRRHISVYPTNRGRSGAAILELRHINETQFLVATGTSDHLIGLLGRGNEHWIDVGAQVMDLTLVDKNRFIATYGHNGQHATELLQIQNGKIKRCGNGLELETGRAYETVYSQEINAGVTSFYNNEILKSFSISGLPKTVQGDNSLNEPFPTLNLPGSTIR